MNNDTTNYTGEQYRVAPSQTTKNADGKNGFVHSGTSPTQGQDFEGSSYPATNSRQLLTTADKDGFYTASGSSPTVREAATRYTQRGWRVLPLPYKEKKSVMTGWPELQLNEEDLPKHFNGKPQNVGVLLGEPSKNLIDIDLDCEEAVQLAPLFLPQTNSVFGRAGKPKSHYLYYVDGECETEKFQDPSRKPNESSMIVELRSTGCQTVMPASTHPSGEEVRWDEDGEPARVKPDRLRTAVERLHKAVLVMRGVEPTPPKRPSVDENAGFKARSNSTSKFATHGERHIELQRLMTAQATKNKRGIYEMNGVCHNGTQSDTALMYNPETGAVYCHGGCDYNAILGCVDITT